MDEYLGWEVCPMNIDVTELQLYDFKVLRRKKVLPTEAPKKEKTMPELMPRVGDVIHYDGSFRVVTKVLEGHFWYLDAHPSSNAYNRNGWTITEFVKRSDAAIYRNGKLIWEKGE